MQKNYYQYAAILLQDNRSVNGTMRFRVKGHSMTPLLLPGDVLTVRQQSVRSLRPGQIIVIVDGGGFLTHRLVAVDADALHTKGDSMRFPDPPAPYTALVGVVQSVERSGRIWLDFTRPGWERVWPRLERLYVLEDRTHRPLPANIQTAHQPTEVEG